MVARKLEDGNPAPPDLLSLRPAAAGTIRHNLNFSPDALESWKVEEPVRAEVRKEGRAERRSGSKSRTRSLPLSTSQSYCPCRRLRLIHWRVNQSPWTGDLQAHLVGEAATTG